MAALIRHCWSEYPQDRPKVNEVVRRLEAILMSACHDLVSEASISTPTDLSPLTSQYQLQKEKERENMQSATSRASSLSSVGMHNDTVATSMPTTPPTTPAPWSSPFHRSPVHSKGKNASALDSKSYSELLREIQSDCAWVPFEKHGGAWALVTPQSPHVFAYTTSAFQEGFAAASQGQGQGGAVGLSAVHMDDLAALGDLVQLALQAVIATKAASSSFASSQSNSNTANPKIAPSAELLCDLPSIAAATTSFLASLATSAGGHTLLPLLVCSSSNGDNSNNNTGSSSSNHNNHTGIDGGGFGGGVMGGTTHNSKSAFNRQNFQSQTLSPCTLHAFPLYHAGSGAGAGGTEDKKVAFIAILFTNIAPSSHSHSAWKN